MTPPVMPPTTIKRNDGGTAFLAVPAVQIREALRRAAHGNGVATIAGRRFEVQHVLEVDGERFDPLASDPVPAVTEQPRRQTTIKLEDGRKVLISSSAKKIRRAIRRALERGETDVSIAGETVAIDRIRTIAGEPFDAAATNTAPRTAAS